MVNISFRLALQKVLCQNINIFDATFDIVIEQSIAKDYNRDISLWVRGLLLLFVCRFITLNSILEGCFCVGRYVKVPLQGFPCRHARGGH